MANRANLRLAGLIALIGLAIAVYRLGQVTNRPDRPAKGAASIAITQPLSDTVPENLRGRPEGNAASGLSGHRLQRLPARQNPELGNWAPVLLLHLTEGVFEGYPAGFAEAGRGEFTLYYWRRFNLFGYYWVDNSGVSRALVVALDLAKDASEQLKGVLTASPSECEWIPASRVRLIRDLYGLHPLFSVLDSRPETGLGDLTGSLPEEGIIDWTGVPEQGLGYRRNWSHQDHLMNRIPASDGVVVRFEAAGGYAQGTRPGRGNHPHHWNLLSYRLAPVEEILPRVAHTADDPNAWVCGGLVDRTAAAIDAAVARRGARVSSGASRNGGRQ